MKGSFGNFAVAFLLTTVFILPHFAGLHVNPTVRTFKYRYNSPPLQETLRKMIKSTF